MSSFRLIAWSSSCFGGNLFAFCSSNTLVCLRYSAGISSIEAIVVLFGCVHALGHGIVTCPFSQSTFGLKVHSHEYPNIIWSSPRLISKNHMTCLWCLLWMVISQYRLIQPALFVVPSTLVSQMGCVTTVTLDLKS